MIRLLANVCVALIFSSAGCGKNPEQAPTTLDTQISDADRFEGVWAIESVDSGDPKMKMPNGSEVKKMRIQFRGNQMATGTEGGAFIEHSIFVLDETADPKVIKTTPVENGKPIQARPGSPHQVFPRENLYKFEGETLVIAQIDVAIYSEKAPPRPSDFTPRPYKQPGTPGVIILRMRKTSEAMSEPVHRQSKQPK